MRRSGKSRGIVSGTMLPPRTVMSSGWAAAGATAPRAATRTKAGRRNFMSVSTFVRKSTAKTALRLVIPVPHVHSNRPARPPAPSAVVLGLDPADGLAPRAHDHGRGGDIVAADANTIEQEAIGNPGGGK